MEEDKTQVTGYEERQRKRRRAIQSFESKYTNMRTPMERFTDAITDFTGSIEFLIINALWFTSWIVVNIGLIPGLVPFDPFPFGLLTMIVSLEAIFLSIFVLVSQNRQSKIDDLREEIDLQVNLIAEEEITKVIHLVAGLYKGLKIKIDDDPELERMMRPLNTNEIEKRLEEQMTREGNILNEIRRTILTQTPIRK
jgi:uncharacterized membrane protein